MRFWLVMAGLNGAMGVGLDAYGWHSLAADPHGREMFAFATRYQIWHALALLGVAFAAGRFGGIWPSIAGWSFLSGILLFSGTLYVLGGFGIVPLMGAAPVGGGLLIAGWLALAWVGLRSVEKDRGQT